MIMVLQANLLEHRGDEQSDDDDKTIGAEIGSSQKLLDLMGKSIVIPAGLYKQFYFRIFLTFAGFM